ncbi:MAG: hypothetical protein AAGI10_06955 [Pseudomonadota bacterium]
MFKLLLAAIITFTASAAASETLQITTPPALRSDKGYLTNIETAIFNGPSQDVRKALQTAETGVLAHAKTTDRIPSISEMRNLDGDFPDIDAVRQLTFSDGNRVIERVIENSDSRFVYQVWDFTAPNARALSHIRGQFDYVPIENGQTQVTWTYSIALRVFLVRPLVRNFLQNDFAPFMESGLQGAAEAYNQRALN